MNYNREFAAKKEQYVPVMSPSMTLPAVEGTVPKKQEGPKVETHISFVIAKKDRKIWVKHETRIIDWKPFTYYETAVGRVYAENAKR